MNSNIECYKCEKREHIQTNCSNMNRIQNNNGINRSIGNYNRSNSTKNYENN